MVLSDKPAVISPKQPKQSKEAVGSLVIKTQLCGKKNCRCKKRNLRHGPYTWLVSYIPVEEKKAGEKYVPYQWTYLGKVHGKTGTKEKTLTKLQEHTTGVRYAILANRLSQFLDRYEHDEEFRRKILSQKKIEI